MVCKVVEVDDTVWKGANKVFKTIPWKRINKDKLEAKRTKEQWERLAKKEEERNLKRVDRIKEIGIDYEFHLRGEKRTVDDGETEISRKKIKKSQMQYSENLHSLFSCRRTCLSNREGTSTIDAVCR
jgi:hypothetical protein